MAHILLIEPDRVLAKLYHHAIVGRGHSVVPCASAQAAVLSADQQTPDLVVLELQLIEHSGIEFLYEFRSYGEWQDIPVIAHTQVPISEFAANWQLFKQELGIAAYLYKPTTSLRQLLANIDERITVAAA